MAPTWQWRRANLGQHPNALLPTTFTEQDETMRFRPVALLYLSEVTRSSEGATRSHGTFLDHVRCLGDGVA